MHWTRGPGNVPRRTLLTPRNQRDRNLQGPKPSEPPGVNPAVPDSRSPSPENPLSEDRFPNRYPKTVVRKPALKGLLLQRPGGQEASPRREKRHAHHAARAFPSIAAGPKAQCNNFPAQPIKTQPRVKPASRLNRLASPNHSRNKSRRKNPKAVPTDRIAPPEGIPIPGPFIPEGTPSRLLVQPTRPKARHPFQPTRASEEAPVIRPFAERCDPKAAPRDPGPEMPSVLVA